MTRALVVLLVLMGVGSPVLAARAPSPPMTAEQKAKKQLEIARGHLVKAKAAFGLGEYEKAVKEWTWAYRIKPEPDLLFNIAQAHRLGGNRTQAKMLYENYLREVPNASNRAEVEAYIAELSAPEPTPTPKPKRKSTRKKKSEPTGS